MSNIRITGLVLTSVLAGGAARGESIWAWTHEASGSGSANVFDGGPVVFDSESTFELDVPRMSFVASDHTRLGSLGAGYLTAGRSSIITRDVGLLLNVDFDSSYAPSLFPGGDLSGGAGEGSLSSVIEFVMPTDELGLDYGYQSEEDIGFEGHSTVTLENVTQHETILSFAGEDYILNNMTLIARTGDLMRLTSEMAGGGSVPPNVLAIRGYDARIRMEFTIPEPATLTLLILGLIPFTRPERLRRAR